MDDIMLNLYKVHENIYWAFSGTFIAIDQLMKIVDDPSITEIDVFNVIYQLRKERRYMVQSLSQYIYVYKCVLEYMIRQKRDSCGDTC